MTFLDTHAAIFLFERRMSTFGPASRLRIERDPLACSPIVRVELALLREIGRIAVDGHVILDGLAVDVGLTVVPDGLDPVAVRAAMLWWTRDPFDRVIVAQASMWDAPLVTRDRLVSAYYPPLCLVAHGATRLPGGPPTQPYADPVQWVVLERRPRTHRALRLDRPRDVSRWRTDPPVRGDHPADVSAQWTQSWLRPTANARLARLDARRGAPSASPTVNAG